MASPARKPSVAGTGPAPAQAAADIRAAPDVVDIASAGSFPASDPPPWTFGRPTGAEPAGPAGRPADETDERPPVLLSAADHDRLVGLANAIVKRAPEVAHLLLEEMDRADVVPTGRVPPNVVAMHSHVAFRDEASGAVRDVQLVYPGEADIGAGRISILSLVGAALVGLAEGQSITWPTQDGRERRLTVLRVSDSPPDQAGA